MKHRDDFLHLSTSYLRSKSSDTDKVSQWDHCLSSLLIRSGLGLGFGVIFSVLLFKRRAWPAWLGLGFGAGRAVEECDSVRYDSVLGKSLWAFT